MDFPGLFAGVQRRERSMRPSMRTDRMARFPQFANLVPGHEFGALPVCRWRFDTTCAGNFRQQAAGPFRRLELEKVQDALEGLRQAHTEVKGHPADGDPPMLRLLEQVGRNVPPAETAGLQNLNRDEEDRP